MSQLVMEKGDLAGVPEPALADGYVLRNYREGDEAGLSRVYTAAFLGCETEEDVHEKMVAHACFTPARLFVLENKGHVVGTAAAWLEATDPGAGYLHMLGVIPDHRGKGLGKALTVATLHYTRDEGFTRQRLLTDDWRVPALCLYLGLGYYPVYTDDTHPERWEAIAEKLDRPEVVARAKDDRRR